jgi:hypothetical protein
MASVNFPAGVGGDGSTVTDDANPSTGLANGGHRTRFVPALAQLVAIALNTVTKATEAAASALTAVNAPGTSGTSTASMAVGAGSKSFTTQTGKAWAAGQPVVISRTSAPATTQMFGTITAYDSGTGAMTVSVVFTAGSGTFTDWTIALTGALFNVDAANAATAAAVQLFGGM